MSLASEFVTFQPEQLVVWAGNPRKTLDQAKLSELAASIKARGIDHPITVRATAAGGVEIIAGQRRYLAAKIAGLHSIPCRVRALTDEEALELSITENAARADVSPIEEAEAIESYLASGRTIEQAADRFGRTVAWVTGRTRLLSLSPAWRERVAADRCPIRHAELLSRLSAATQSALSTRYEGRELPTFYEFERAAQLTLHRLSEAPFPLGDDSYPRGSCDACSTRSDKQRDLFSAEADEDASCLDPTCWAVKVEHRWTLAQRDAKKRRLRVLTAEEARLLDNGTTLPSSEWIEMERAARYGTPARAIARTRDGRVIELATREEFDRAATAKLEELKRERDARTNTGAPVGATVGASDRAEVEPTAPTAPVIEDEDGEDDPEEIAREQEQAKRFERDAEILAVALVHYRRDLTDSNRRAMLRFCGLGIEQGAQPAILKALGIDGNDWAKITETEDLSRLLDAMLIDNVLACAKPGEIERAFADGLALAEAGQVAPKRDEPDESDAIAKMVARFAEEIDGARSVRDLGDAWAAIESEDHRASLPALAKLWTAKAERMGVSAITLKKLRKENRAPSAELGKAAA